MNLARYNKVLYKGNINRDFYLYCLKEDFKLIRYFFINIFWLFLSFFSFKAKTKYDSEKFIYLKEIKHLDAKVKNFYKKKNRFNQNINDNIDIVVERVPKILIPKDKAQKLIAYETLENYKVNLEKFDQNLKNIKSVEKLYVNKICDLKTIKFNKLVVVKRNILFFFKRRFILPNVTYTILGIVLLSLFLTCVSFLYTGYIVDPIMVNTYFEIKLFLLNFIPIVLFVTLLTIITKRLHISYLVITFAILALGIANQTKLIYRDDVVKLGDLSLFKEAMTMTTRYAIYIRWYTIILFIMTIVMFFVIRRFLPKFKYKLKKHLILIISFLGISLLIFNKVILNPKLYDLVGDTSIINTWISTRQSQIRGLVYPFIYSYNEISTYKPYNYSEEEVEKILDKYEYQDLKDNQKVNVIAIMLEAYNDFSEFKTIDFTEDIYKELHDIEKKSISGNLITSVFGGETVVTERNFLTGYYFFNTKFREPTNSHVWYFKEQGYRTIAMHPVYGAFYNRLSINLNLGFDKYYHFENYFTNVGEPFVKDDVFFEHIIKDFEKAKADNVPYFNFSVTYQNHGPYKSDAYEGKEYFFKNNNYNEEAYNMINSYFSGIKKTNKALKDLIDYFEKEESPTIVIFFGDHNPYLGEGLLGYSEFGINMDVSTIEGFENYYSTPYVIYANKGAKKVFDKKFVGDGGDISPMFLMNNLFDYCGLKGNSYMQYMSDLKENMDVISNYYFKEDDEYIAADESKKIPLYEEYRRVNYYYSHNYKYNK